MPRALLVFQFVGTGAREVSGEQNNTILRTMEWFELEEILINYLAPAAMGRCLSLDQAAQCTIQPGLESFWSRVMEQDRKSVTG